MVYTDGLEAFKKKHYLNVESYSFMNALCGCS
jgi:hypothetical protein